MGPNCEVDCLCKNGTCSKKGLCSSCNQNYYGTYCNYSCDCVNGLCDDDINGTGSCICPLYFSGEKCDQRCIDPDCLINCSCNDNCVGNNINCTNDLFINNQNFSLTNLSQIFFQGNVQIIGSNLTLSSENLITNSNITISNSYLFFNSSTIISNGCINLTNTHLIIDLSQIQKNTSKLVLISSSYNV